MNTTYDVTGIAGGGGDAQAQRYEPLLAGASWDAATRVAATRSRERNWNAVIMTRAGDPQGTIRDTWVDGQHQPGGLGPIYEAGRAVQYQPQGRPGPLALSDPTDVELLAREMFPGQYAAITDDNPMDPALVQEVHGEMARRQLAAQRAATAGLVCTEPEDPERHVHIHLENPLPPGATITISYQGAGLGRLEAEIGATRRRVAEQLAYRQAHQSGATKGDLREGWSRLRGLIMGHLMASGWDAPGDPGVEAGYYAQTRFGIDLRAMITEITEISTRKENR